MPYGSYIKVRIQDKGTKNAKIKVFELVAIRKSDGDWSPVTDTIDLST